MHQRLVALSACLVAAFAGIGTAQEIGVVASIDPNLVGTPPGASERTLSLGNPVVLNELVVSNRTGRGQLMFVDETTLSIAPSSRIVLDTFVYNPNQGGGRMGLSLTQGALRFIGGRTTKTREAEIQTPSATIGIRGSSALVSYRGGETTAVFLTGDRMCITNGQGRVCTTKKGAVLTDRGYSGVINNSTLRDLLVEIDGEAPQQLVRRRSPSTNIQGSISPRSLPLSTNGTTPDVSVLGLESEPGSGLGIFGEKTTSDRIREIMGSGNGGMSLNGGVVTNGGSGNGGTGNGGSGNGGSGNGGSGNGGSGNGGSGNGGSGNGGSGNGGSGNGGSGNGGYGGGDDDDDD